MLHQLAVGISTGIIIGWGTSAYAQDSVIQSVRNATIYLEVNFRDENNPDNVCASPSQGTGFIVSSGGGVITAAHLFNVEECENYKQQEVKARIGYLSSPEVPMSIVSVDLDTDIAVLQLGARAEPYPFISPCFMANLPIQTKLLAFGFPLGEDFQVLDAVSQGLSGQDGRWKVSSLFTYGMSGGPVTDLSGRVIGLVQGGVRGAPAVQRATPLQWGSDDLSRAGAFSVQSCPEISVGNNIEDFQVADLAKFPVKVEIMVKGPKRSLVEKMFTHDFSNDASCTESWSTQMHAACLDREATINSVFGPLVISASNDGRSWYEKDSDRPYCAILYYGYSDRGEDPNGNCRGNGWIKASYRVTGIVDGEAEAREEVLEDEFVVSENGTTSKIFLAPPSLIEGLNTDELTWSYLVTVLNSSGVMETQLNKAMEKSGKFESKQESDGTVIVSRVP
jgi:hypothetical protein